MQKKKIMIVGAGLTGAVIGRKLAEAGYPVTIVESRPYVAGNCYTERDRETGVMVHVHGPHIFHTDDEAVWKFANDFADFVPYELRVKATTGGRVYSLPINLLTINQFFGTTHAPEEARKFIESRVVQSQQAPVTFEDQALQFLGKELYEGFFKGYPIKQWGLHPNKLPASVLKRLPVRFNYDDNYFAHKYQGIPRDGYTSLVANILDHELIDVRLNENFLRSDAARFDHVFYSGPLDGWFDYEYGRLGYRTLRFERSVHDNDFQGCAVMSYPEEKFPFTRISEHKHFTPWEKFEKTVVFKEYSSQAREGDVLYYPIRLAEEQRLLKKYLEKAKHEKDVSFVGRLGTYRYLDMDVTIAEALKCASSFLDNESQNEPIPQFFVDPN
ncbi:MAG: UDP-galactopyranose mutase [Pseudomonas sp.]|jgi:UDP-galactopyranose mutase|uniref:UDP-galactopyranose mutase n=1 Tax=Pseudomonas sp. TaxID=306 RepID=UPI00121C7384|nr:UDP-galactopyranose mutase [Pseudomonas sp.]RZI71986.1 MAG: UDP-galactopyranose mutase [Pseudomonas sp.]